MRMRDEALRELLGITQNVNRTDWLLIREIGESAEFVKTGWIERVEEKINKVEERIKKIERLVKIIETYKTHIMCTNCDYAGYDVEIDTGFTAKEFLKERPCPQCHTKPSLIGCPFLCKPTKKNSK